MASCTSGRRGTACLVLVTLATSGCVTGHLLDAGRRREQLRAYREAFIDGDRLVVGYTAVVTDDAGDTVEVKEAWAAVALRDLRPGEAPPVEAFPVERLSASEASRRRGTRVSLREGTEPADGTAQAPSMPALHIERVDGRDVAAVLHDGASPRRHAPLPSGALTRLGTAKWVYPLLPAALVIDVVTNPPLLLLAPAVMVVGE
jgi:hypothetical protein